MLIYPIGESKTEFTFAPWATLILMLVSVIAFVTVLPKLNKQITHQKDLAEIALEEAVSRQYSTGGLDQAYWLRFKEDPSIVADPQLGMFFSQDARLAWLRYSEEPPPLSTLLQRRPHNLILSLVPHHGLLLVLGLACLGIMGFLFEHQYDRQVILTLFVASGCSWVILQAFIPAAFAPSPIFAWSHTVMVLLTVAWLTAPRANINLAVRGWLIKPFGWEMEIPAVMIPCLYVTAHCLITLFLSPYRPWFDMMHLAAVATEATLFSLILVFVPARPGGLHETPDQIADRKLAEAKVFFDKDEVKAGMALLHDLVIHDLDRARLRSVAELAWKNDAEELADQCYRKLLRKTQGVGEEALFLEIVSEMLFRRMTLGGTSIVKAVELATRSGRMSQVKKLLPYLYDNQEISHETTVDTMSMLAETLLIRREPDRRFLSDIKDWFEKNAPGAPVINEMNNLFQTGARESQLTGSFVAHKSLHRMVPVDLVDVRPEKVIIQIEGQKEQNIPWTAFTAVFGCHIASGQRGYRGCLVINFKRKVFGCTFTTSHILMREGSEPVTFEKAWVALKTHIPEDLPFLEMSAFPALKTEDDIQEAVEAFINQEEEVL